MIKRLPYILGLLLIALTGQAVPSSKFTLTVSFSDGHQSMYQLNEQPELIWEKDSLFIYTPLSKIGVTYGEFKSLAFTEGTSTVQGDINGDGVVDTGDALLVYDYMKNGKSPYAIAALDLNGDGLVDTQDVLQVYERIRWSVKKRNMPIMKASGIDQMVVVTAQGDLLAYNLSDGPSLTRDDMTDSLTLNTLILTRSFLKYGIKQIYFEDKAIVDQDPYVAPTADDYMNPNLVTHDSIGYEVIALDTLLGHATLRFEKEIPNLYVGQIYIARNDTVGMPMYVLTYDMLNNHDVFIRYRPATINEMLYNCVITLSSTPDDPYFTLDSVGLDMNKAKSRRRVYRVPINSMLDVDYDNSVKPEIKLIKNLDNLFGNSNLGFDYTVKPTLNFDIQLVIGEAIEDESTAREIMSKIDLFQFVAKGGIQFEEKLKLNLSLNALTFFDFPIDKEIYTIKTLPWIPFIHGVPVFLHIEPEIRGFADALLKGQMMYAQTMRQSVEMKAGVRYEGKTNKLTPIFQLTPSLHNDKPTISAIGGEVGFSLAAYPRINCRMYKLLNFYLDLMPIFSLTNTAFMMHEKSFFQTKLDFDFKIRAGVKVELSRPTITQSQKEWYKEHKDDFSLTFNAYQTNLLKIPNNIYDKDSLNVQYAGYKTRHNIVWGTQGFVEQIEATEHKKEYFNVDKGEQMSVEHQCMSDFPMEEAQQSVIDDQVIQEISEITQTNNMMAKNRLPAKIRNKLPQFLQGDEEYDLVAQLTSPAKAPLRMVTRRVDGKEETGIGGLAEGLRKTGDPWATQCDENAEAHMDYEWDIPIGYRNVLRTSIIDSLGHPIMSIDREMPWEIKNFNASWTTSEANGTVEYRDGGETITEHLITKDGSVTFIYHRSNNSTTITTSGITATRPGRMLIGTTFMGSPETIILSNKTQTFKGHATMFDMMNWQAEHMKTNPYAGKMMFGSGEYLGYPCKTVTLNNQTIYWYQNLYLRVDGEANFRVTELNILDDLENPTAVVYHSTEG